MPKLDDQIDDLYKGPLKEFVQRRAALAKSLSGAQAREVKALHKPTVAPWVVNQLYWRGRSVYNRLVTTGEKLRAAQINALKGRPADVRGATDAHRQAMSEAVTQSLQLASEAGARPPMDELTKMLEAVSLAGDLPEAPGRFTKILRPAGFEALAGVPMKTTLRLAPPPQPRKEEARKKEAEEDRRKKEEGKRKKEEGKRRKEIARAKKITARAKAEEARTRAAWERSKEALAAAELALSALKLRA